MEKSNGRGCPLRWQLMEKGIQNHVYGLRDPGDPNDMTNNLTATKMLEFNLHCKHSSSLNQPWGETGGKWGPPIPSNAQVAGNKCSDMFYRIAIVGSLGWGLFFATSVNTSPFTPKASIYLSWWVLMIHKGHLNLLLQGSQSPSILILHPTKVPGCYIGKEGRETRQSQSPQSHQHTALQRAQ